TAPENVLRIYERHTADPAFAESARLEKAVLAGPTQGTDIAACFRVMAAKLDRLRDVETCSAATLLRSPAARGNRRGPAPKAPAPVTTTAATRAAAATRSGMLQSSCESTHR